WARGDSPANRGAEPLSNRAGPRRGGLRGGLGDEPRELWPRVTVDRGGRLRQYTGRDRRIEQELELGCLQPQLGRDGLRVPPAVEQREDAEVRQREDDLRHPVRPRHGADALWRGDRKRWLFD